MNSVSGVTYVTEAYEPRPKQASDQNVTPYMTNYSWIVVCENLPLARSLSEVTDAV